MREVTDPAPTRPQLRFAGVSEILDALEWREFTCPECGRAVRLRATPNMTIEWERGPDGRRFGLLMRPAGLLSNYAYEVGIDAVVTATGGSQMANAAELPAEVVEMLRLPADAPMLVSELVIHHCPFGGTANDRLADAPQFPSDQSSVALPWPDAPQLPTRARCRASGQGGL